jgi:hypothetical protein
MAMMFAPCSGVTSKPTIVTGTDCPPGAACVALPRVRTFTRSTTSSVEPGRPFTADVDGDLVARLEQRGGAIRIGDADRDERLAVRDAGFGRHVEHVGQQELTLDGPVEELLSLGPAAAR